MRHLVNLALFEALGAAMLALQWAADPSDFAEGAANYGSELFFYNLYFLPLLVLYVALLGWVARKWRHPRRAAFVWALVAFLPLLVVGVAAPFSDDYAEMTFYALLPLGMGALSRLPESGRG